MKQSLIARIADLTAIISSAHWQERGLRSVLSSPYISSRVRVQASSALVVLLRKIGKAAKELKELKNG
jgi:hypothetical protein